MQHIKSIPQNHKGIQLSVINSQWSARHRDLEIAPTEDESGFEDPSYGKTICPCVSTFLFASTPKLC